MRILGAFLVGLALLAPVSGVSQAQSGSGSGFNLFSTEQDVELGKQSAAKVEAQMPMLSVPATSRLVEQLGRRLAANAPGPKFTYRFKVVNLSDVNAFALPGGFVYVHRGLVERARTEGQLAGVMAHEIAHVALRHQTRQVTKAYAAQAGFGLLTSLFDRGATQSSGMLNAVGGLGMNALFLKFSRTAESQADASGAEIMSRAGYDPAEMADFFELLRQDAGSDPSRVAVFLSDHPSPVSREASIRGMARNAAGSGHVKLVGGLDAAQNELRRLPKAKPMSQVVSAN